MLLALVVVALFTTTIVYEQTFAVTILRPSPPE